MEAKALLKQALARCQELGVQSVRATWNLAVACDESGSPEEALPYIVETLQMDPLCSVGISSLNLIASHVRDALADPDRDRADPATPKSCALLLQVGEADARTHVALARYHGATGKVDRAVAILEALATLDPENETVLRELVEVATLAGREDLIQRASSALEHEGAVVELRSVCPTNNRPHEAPQKGGR